MGAIEVGVDIVEIDRIEQSIRRFGDRFRNRVFTSVELEQSGGRASSLAARFAAKEAVIKAFDCTSLELREIEVVRPPGRRPELRLSGGAARHAREISVVQLRLSLSHSRRYAVAVVVLERSESVSP